jgi:opacity protein-like surface antigen
MSIRARLLAVLAVTTISLIPSGAAAQQRWAVDFENGAVFSGYNDVRIPGDTGTTFSLTDDLKADPAYFWRVRVDFRAAPKHVLSVLAAPLSVDSSGTFNRPVSFAGETFAPGVPVTGRYMFNSYRVTYRYEFLDKGGWRFGIGATVKVRDAATILDSQGTHAEKTNVGVVPLVNFKLERDLGGRAVFRFEGDALAAPQGRAEDVFAGIIVRLHENVSLKAGYRLLEGGADNAEVYTFAAFHYASVGAIIRF